MTLHEKGVKSERDRAILINSYETMCNEFRLPASKRLSRADMSRMSNAALYLASKDVYSQASVKQANRLAVKMGLRESWYQRNIGKYVDNAVKSIQRALLRRKLRRQTNAKAN